MFIYRPHVHQLDGTITPDLVVDRLFVGREEVPNVLSDQVVYSGCGATCIPAIVLVGAGYGTLMGLGFVFSKADQGTAQQCFIGRAAWRLADVAAQSARLQVELRWHRGGVDSTHQGVPTSGRWVDPARGVAVCWTEPAWRVPSDAQWCSVGLHDPANDRALTHRLELARSTISN